MPLRRRPQEPSPRLLALLSEAETARGSPGQDRGTARVLGASTEPWLPRREWLEASAAPAPGGSPSAGRAPAGPAPAGPAPVGLPPDAPGPAPDAADGLARSPERHATPPQPGRHRRPRPPGPALLTLPAALKDARVSGPRAAVAGMVLVVLVAAAVFGVRVAWARAASSPEVVERSEVTSRRVSTVSSDGPSEGFRGAGTHAPGGAAQPASAPANGAEVVVHVVGQVRRPGVVVLRVGARVRDAITKAGGALAGADLATLNLARPVADGEQVRVPKPGEAVAAAPGGPGGDASTAGAGGGAGPVNLNTANLSVLEELPGVGPVLAQRIVDWRTEHGRFTSVDELAEVSGIGEKMFAQLQGKVTV